MTKEEQLQEIREKIFQVQVKLYENEGVFAEELNRFNRDGVERCKKIQQECFKETICRMQDYEDVLADIASKDDLNYLDYSWLQ